MHTESTGPMDIGVATMENDGTITMKLSVNKPSGIACGTVRYGIHDPFYATVLAHLGTLKPGQTVTVKEFPTA